MWTDVVAVAGLSLLAGAWVLVQQWVGRHDPQQPGVEGSRCGRQCTGACEGDGECEREAAAEGPRRLRASPPHPVCEARSRSVRRSFSSRPRARLR